MRLTVQQRRCAAILQGSRDRLGRCCGCDIPTLARLLETSEHGAAATASSLVRRGYAVRFMGGVGVRRTHYQWKEGQ